MQTHEKIISLMGSPSNSQREHDVTPPEQVALRLTSKNEQTYMWNEPSTFLKIKNDW